MKGGRGAKVLWFGTDAFESGERLNHRAQHAHKFGHLKFEVVVKHGTHRGRQFKELAIKQKAHGPSHRAHRFETLSHQATLIGGHGYCFRRHIVVFHVIGLSAKVFPPPLSSLIDHPLKTSNRTGPPALRTNSSPTKTSLVLCPRLLAAGWIPVRHMSGPSQKRPAAWPLLSCLPKKPGWHPMHAAQIP